ncbi:glycosyltransferase family 39 protein [Sporolactobacillus shoreae]|uniref:Glycosyltransferase family 39 protein n=1 Tax=Sporolactobacillus shoreae TaxID=1465501 RepID=A0A4Z0GL73_9BACL|nr:glycosyltransferase family 39 protein [Sporolactobacillus shoreae]TGA97703.1 glycosyltransferase family 39 protein [Sporolactobacillus shoreae]
MNRFKKWSIDYYFVGVAALSLILNFSFLNQAGTNEYYTVAVKSMMKNFHNFFYASFDPAGFITVDKPPVALWLQVLSAKIFGFSNFSVLLPEAAAGVISCMILYQMVKKKAGLLAAVISGAALALTPIFTTVARTNNVDSILILALMLAAGAVIKATDSGKVRWLIVSTLLVGIGFNVKMLEAFMVLPAIYLFYWLAMKVNWKKKILHLAVATIVLAVVSLSWAVTVDLIPASDRPYIGSSQTNSVLELAFGYNGISRLTGQHNTGSAAFTGNTANHLSRTGNTLSTETNGTGTENGTPPSLTNAGAGNTMPKFSQRGGQGGGMFGTGQAGPLRLFSAALSGQASWLLPFALFGLIGLVVDFIRRRKLTQEHTFAIFWLAWLVPAMAFFSVAGFFHQYYLSLMGPPIAALTGINASILWTYYLKERDFWTSLILPVAACMTLLFEALIFYQNSISAIWTTLTAAAGILSLVLGLGWRTGGQKLKRGLALAGLCALLLPPLYWTMPAVMNQTNSSIPSAGPVSTTAGAMGGGGQMTGHPMSFAGGTAGRTGTFSQNGENNKLSGEGFSQWRTGTAKQWMKTNNRITAGNFGSTMGTQENTKLLSYLEKHDHGQKYILAVQNAQSAYSIMLKTDYAVMAMGGFQGSDPAMNVAKLENMVKAGEVKYFLISSDRFGAQNSSVTAWIQKNCVKVPDNQWSTQNSGSQAGPGGQSVLYVYNG